MMGMKAIIKKLKYLLILLTLLFAGQQSIFAAHVMSAEIGWTYVGHDSIIVKLTLYYDCNYTFSPATTNLQVKCASTGAVISSVYINPTNPVDITPVCKTSCTRCQSSTCSFPYGIHKYVYQSLVLLSSAGSCCNLIINWHECCRLTSITTGAGNYDFYTEATLNRCQGAGYNSPRLANEPVKILCVGLDFAWSAGETSVSADPRDSITYEMAQPLQQSSGYNIAYTGSYDYERPVYFWGFPNAALPYPRGFHLDPQAGVLTFRPMKAEITVMVIKMNVFRNGIKIADLRREATVLVMTCTGNNPPVITTPNGYVKSVAYGDSVSFDFTSSDPNGDTSYLSWDHSITGATWTHNNGQQLNPAAKLYWKPKATDAKGGTTRTFVVWSRDNGCPVNASSSRPCTINFTCKNNRNPQLSIKGNSTSKTVCMGDTVTFEFATADPDSLDTIRLQYKNPVPGAVWTSTDGTSARPTAKFFWIPPVFDTIYSKTYSFVVTYSDHACPFATEYAQTINITVKPRIPGNINVIDKKCGNYEMILNPYATGKNYIFNLTIQGNKTANAHKTSNIKINYPGSYPYSLTISDYYACSRTFTDTLVTDSLFNIRLPADTSLCAGSNLDIIPVLNFYSGKIKYYWSTADTVSQLQLTSLSQSNTFILWATDSAGCTAIDTMQVKVRPNPAISMLKSYNICRNSDIWIKPAYSLADTSNRIVLYEWQRKNDPLVISNSSQLLVIDSGTFQIRATDKFGCSTTDSVRVNYSAAVDTSLTINNPMLIAGPGAKRYDWYRNKSRMYSGPDRTYLVLSEGDYYAIITNIDNCTASTRTVHVKPPVGISSNLNPAFFSIFPNPTTGKLILQINEPNSSDISLSLFNVYGKEILTKTYKVNEYQKSVELDLSDQPSGTYEILIRYQNSYFHQLIIKE
jgi:hypothetical protein